MPGRIRETWARVKATKGFHSLLTFLVFVAIAALFWFFMALNENTQDDFEVKLNIYNVPDTVTFINVPPAQVHVLVRDKGTNLWRIGVISKATLNVNFRDYATQGNIFRISKSEMNGLLKNVFGPQAAIISSSVDSLRLSYTTLPGKRVPVDLQGVFTAAVGKVLTGKPVVTPSSVTVYSTQDVLDTISRVFTERVSRSGVEESQEFPVTIRPVAGVRITPATVNVKVEVEPLVKREVAVAIHTDNVPAGADLLLFPSKVRVEYFTPMSRFSDDVAVQNEIRVNVDYNEIRSGHRKLPLHLGLTSPVFINPKLLADSVEYTLVK